MHTITRRIGQSTRHTSMSNRIARWLSRIGLLALVLSLGVFSSPAQPAAAAGFSASANVSGTGIRITASYSSSLSWNVQVSTAAIITSSTVPTFDTGGTLGPRIHSYSSSGTNFDHFFGGLFADKNYNFIISAGGGYRTGSITTLKRQLTVNFTKIDVIDDGDFVASGEDTFYFNVDGKWVFQTDELYPNSPTTLDINKIYATFTTSTLLSLAVHGVDDDCDFGELCTYGIGPGYTAGWDYQHDWNTAKSGSISYASLGAPDANDVTKEITFETPSSQSYPKFKVYAKVSARYF